MLFEQALFKCPVEKEDYLRGHPPGHAEVLCHDMGHGAVFPVLSYSENGIYVPALKEKYAKNLKLVEQEGLKPGDPRLFETRHHKTQYYARVQWIILGFRRVGE